ncbi:hypothetical protein BKA70DRAFT_254638 [Coprinopsis sp. MPI-PUGE-AT-0042]|nr:hypothetical protein BKA70DRAFT_254638 [Coprinopsis sp. MPI-PUGE-AT-0042]
MSLTVDVDPRILPYISNNDPLPLKLGPVLNGHLDVVRHRVAACSANIRGMAEQIMDRQRKIRALEEEIETLRTELLHQKDVKDKHNATIRALAGTTSIVRRLPPEIVASIISFSVVEGWAGFSEQYLCNASAVSKLWRSTTLSTPSLWRFLSVSLDRFSNGRSRDQAWCLFSSTLDLWFSRGGEGAKVSLWLDPARGGGLLVSDIIGWILSSRFKFASLKLENIALSFPELQCLLSNNTPSLHETQDLSLYLPTPWEVWADFSDLVAPIDIGLTLPKLKELTLAIAPVFGVIPARFIHPGLTKLEPTHVRLRDTELTTLLKGLPSLQSLQLSCSYGSAMRIQSADEPRAKVVLSLTHRSLREIIIYDGIPDFFDGLSCPALEFFYLDSDSALHGLSSGREARPGDAQALGTFLHRSKPSNLSLHLGAQFTSTFLNEVFQASGSAIEALHLRSSVSLPLEVSDEGIRLAIPSSVQSICVEEWMPEEECTAWNQKLELSLDDPPNLVLTVTFADSELDE